MTSNNNSSLEKAVKYTIERLEQSFSSSKDMETNGRSCGTSEKSEQEGNNGENANMGEMNDGGAIMSDMDKSKSFESSPDKSIVEAGSSKTTATKTKFQKKKKVRFANTVEESYHTPSFDHLSFVEKRRADERNEAEEIRRLQQRRRGL